MITKEIINDIAKIIAAEYQPERIILFGSCATGQQTADSDIDLMILFQKEFSRKEKLDLLYKIQIKCLHLNHPVDVVIKSTKQFDEYKNYVGTINYDVARQGKTIWTRQ